MQPEIVQRPNRWAGWVGRPAGGLQPGCKLGGQAGRAPGGPGGPGSEGWRLAALLGGLRARAGWLGPTQSRSSSTVTLWRSSSSPPSILPHYAFTKMSFLSFTASPKHTLAPRPAAHRNHCQPAIRAASDTPSSTRPPTICTGGRDPQPLLLDGHADLLLLQPLGQHIHLHLPRRAQRSRHSVSGTARCSCGVSAGATEGAMERDGKRAAGKAHCTGPGPALKVLLVCKLCKPKK